jgi:hypothetical protein
MGIVMSWVSLSVHSSDQVEVLVVPVIVVVVEAVVDGDILLLLLVVLTVDGEDVDADADAAFANGNLGGRAEVGEGGEENESIVIDWDAWRAAWTRLVPSKREDRVGDTNGGRRLAIFMAEDDEDDRAPIRSFFPFNAGKGEKDRWGWWRSTSPLVLVPVPQEPAGVQWALVVVVAVAMLFFFWVFFFLLLVIVVVVVVLVVFMHGSTMEASAIRSDWFRVSAKGEKCILLGLGDRSWLDLETRRLFRTGDWWQPPSSSSSSSLSSPSFSSSSEWGGALLLLSWIFCSEEKRAAVALMMESSVSDDDDRSLMDDDDLWWQTTGAVLSVVWTEWEQIMMVPVYIYIYIKVKNKKEPCGSKGVDKVGRRDREFEREKERVLSKEREFENESERDDEGHKSPVLFLYCIAFLLVG